ncbi:helix-turn-helix domain-containing protein [Flavobacterium sp. CS20]|jgi:excisionase family DNA binding protein|uniref:helix-turn-helix domain-containing protein n=1 Tax=Flavobacterium sp. CS20 TaxID=2775246 RepID=UPI001B3A76D9|nr:helix-turn-helix domain-containing protein [Flavobacterium sp. CS20]QTY26600.1 helix-turn-helix domain-containing protein [Flavobacterium sp. CS20]
MELFKTINKPSKDEQKIAFSSYDTLISVINKIKTEHPIIEIEETEEKIKLPLNALKLLGNILKTMSEGKAFSLVPSATEVSTQKAAEVLGCSRPHLVKLLEKGELNYTKVGKHRRLKFEDVMDYKIQMKANQKQHIIDIMQSDEESELYDS